MTTEIGDACSKGCEKDLYNISTYLCVTFYVLGRYAPDEAHMLDGCCSSLCG